VGAKVRLDNRYWLDGRRKQRSLISTRSEINTSLIDRRAGAVLNLGEETIEQRDIADEGDVRW
jgi:hypothetical protein